MSGRVICDASVALSLVMPDETSWFAQEVAEASVDGRLHVPAVWPAEVLNALRSNVLRERIQPSALAEAVQQLGRLGPVVAAAPRSEQWARWLIDLSHNAGCSAYDASYLLLAEQVDGTLATRDGNLRRVAVARGLPCLGLPNKQ